MFRHVGVGIIATVLLAAMTGTMKLFGAVDDAIIWFGPLLAAVALVPAALLSLKKRHGLVEEECGPEPWMHIATKFVLTSAAFGAIL